MVPVDIHLVRVEGADCFTFLCFALWHVFCLLWVFLLVLFVSLLCSVIVAIPRRLLYFLFKSCSEDTVKMFRKYYSPEAITKTCLYNFDPLKPHFDVVKLGFTGVNIDYGYSLEPPCGGGSNEYPQSMFLSRNMKYIRVFYLNFFSFWRRNFLYI